jgi:hypothetical protein
MENQTAFDLNRAVESWREILARSGSMDRESVDELESHLRHSIVALQTSGLSIEESFMIAKKRIGRSDDIDTEFAKVAGTTMWNDWVPQLLICIQIWFTFNYMGFSPILTLWLWVYVLVSRVFPKLPKLVSHPLRLSIVLFLVCAGTQLYLTYTFWRRTSLFQLRQQGLNLNFLAVSLTIVATIALLSRRHRQPIRS